MSAKIYKTFEELKQQNKSLFRFIGKEEHDNLYRAVWEARQGEIFQLEQQIEQLKSAQDNTKLNTKTLKRRLKERDQSIADLQGQLEAQEERCRYLTLDQAQTQEEIQFVYEEIDVIKLELEQAKEAQKRDQEFLAQFKQNAHKAKRYALQTKTYAQKMQEYAREKTLLANKALLELRRQKSLADEAQDQTRRAKEMAKELREGQSQAKDLVVQLHNQQQHDHERIAELKRQLDHARRRLAAKDQEIVGQKTEIDSLRRELEHLVQLVGKIKNVMGPSSTSCEQDEKQGVNNSSSTRGLSLV